MKRGVFAVTMTVMAAGVASALAFAPTSQPAPRPVASRPPAEAAAPAAVQAAQAKAPLDARQAPVPLLMKARPAVEVPAIDAGTPQQQSAATPAEATAGEGAVKAAVEADGYKGVKVLRKGANGLWYAEAMRGRTKVMLTVDAQGNVAAE